MQRSATPDPVLRDDNVHLSLPRGPTWFPQSGAGTPFASLPRWFGRAEPAAASAPLDAHLNPAVLSAMALDHNPGIPPAPSPSPTGALPLYEDHWDPEFTYPGAASAPPNYSTLSSTQSERTATIDAPRYDTQSLSRRLDAASHGAYKVGRKIGEGTLAVVREAVNVCYLVFCGLWRSDSRILMDSLADRDGSIFCPQDSTH